MNIKKPTKTTWTLLRQALVILGLIIIGVLIRDVVFGQIIILIYAVVALIRSIESATTFKLAIIMLVAVPLVYALHNPLLAQTFATYAFLLLLVGLVCAVREQYAIYRKIPRISAKNVVKKAKVLAAPSQSGKIKTIVSK